MANQQLGIGNTDNTLTISNQIGHSFSPIYNVGGTGNSGSSGYYGSFGATFATDQDAKQESTGSLGLGIGGGTGSGGEVSKGGDNITDTPLLSTLTNLTSNKYLLYGAIGIAVFSTIFIILKKRKKKAK